MGEDLEMPTTVGEFIKRDHDDFRLIFERLMASTADETALRGEVYPFLRERVHAHHVAEEATIFPQMEKNDALRPATLVLIEEHRGMDMLARDLAETPADSRLWRPRVFPFYDVISRHWEREETDIFVHARLHLSPEILDEAAQKFEEILERQWTNAGLHAGMPPAMKGR
jgi:hemerythrin-like domain-containing protein